MAIDPASARMLDSRKRYTQCLLHRMQRDSSRRFHGRRQPSHRTAVGTRRRTGRPPLQGAAAGRGGPHRRASWRPSAATCSRAASPPRSSPCPPSARAQPRAAGDVRGAARPGLRAARQDVDGPAALRPPAGVRRLGHHAAVPHQARVYRAFGIARIFLANELVDAVALRWLAGELDADPASRSSVTSTPCAASS